MASKIESFIDFGYLILGMKGSEYDCYIEGKAISFYHNQKTHRYEVVIDFDVQNPYEITKAKGEAVIEFLKLLLSKP
jgi:hypothetical protein